MKWWERLIVYPLLLILIYSSGRLWYEQSINWIWWDTVSILVKVQERVTDILMENGLMGSKSEPQIDDNDTI